MTVARGRAKSKKTPELLVEDDGTLHTTGTLKPATRAGSVALAATGIASAAPCTLRSLTIWIDASAPSGTYFVQVFNAAAPPADSAAPDLVERVDHTTGTTDRVTFDGGDAGETFTAGVSWAISSTRATKTASGAYAWFSAGAVPS